MTAPIERLAQELALLLARRRFGSGVYMNGAHNPTPGEEYEARRFVQDMLHNGWVPPEAADHA